MKLQGCMGDKASSLLIIISEYLHALSKFYGGVSNRNPKREKCYTFQPIKKHLLYKVDAIS